MVEQGSSRRDVVVVGVDGSDDAARAVRYAVEEIGRTGGRMRLVHVVPEAVPMATMLPLFGTDTLVEVGRRILADAESLALSLAPEGAHVETALAHGPRVNALLSHARDAALIVLGRRPSLIARIRTGSTTSAVAARADCPVVGVPDEWGETPRHGRVVAAVDGSSASTAVLKAGLAAAHDRHAQLVVLHAWRPMAPYESVLAGGRAADTWQRQAEPVVWAMVAGLRAAYPDVEVQVDLHYERTADALVAAGRSADLMVLGRRGDGPSFGLLLGSMPRALLRAGVCPIEVVPFPAPSRRVPRQQETPPAAAAPVASESRPVRRK
jgi:nucleotide-binding universal stress UspA family protein